VQITFKTLYVRLHAVSQTTPVQYLTCEPSVLPWCYPKITSTCSHQHLQAIEEAIAHNSNT
jgi:hypothetical protein